MTTKTTPVEKTEKISDDKYVVMIREMVSNQHSKAYKIDIKSLWNSAWRVNVYFKDDQIVPRIEMPFTYFVKIDTDDSILFTPNLGVKTSINLKID